MLPQVFEAADTVSYRGLPLQCSWDIAHYFPELITPPRIYQESIDSLIALATVDVPNPWARYSLLAIVAMNQVCWPSWSLWAYFFDPYQGRLFERREMTAGGTLTIDTITQSRDGALWELDSYGVLRRRDPVTLDYTGDSYPATYFAGRYLTGQQPSFVIDTPRKRAILHSNGEVNDQIGVYDLATGALIRRIGVAGHVHVIAPEDDARVYVVSKGGILSLVDTETGETLGVSRQQITPEVLHYHVHWDRHLRRLLTLERTPDAFDGASTTRIRGFVPRPQAVGLTPPLPLAVPRKGRQAPILVHAYGDAGEPIGGLKLTLTATAPGSLSAQSAQTGRDGDAKVLLAGSAAADAILTAEAQP